MAAALSYYTIFSLSPLLVIVVGIMGTIWGMENVRSEIISETSKLFGEEGSKFISTIIDNSGNSGGGVFATVISSFVLLLGAIGVFLEMKESLNVIWGVEPKPNTGLWGMVKNRLYLVPMILALGFILLISMLLNTILNLIFNFTKFISPEFLKYAEIGHYISLFIISTIFFSLIFKFLPDVQLKWKQIIRGSLVTASLFTIGKFLIGLYIANSALSSTYGAAASAFIILLWIYYSGVILYFGAEFMYSYNTYFINNRVEPQDDAIRIPKTSELVNRKQEEKRK